VPSIVSRIFAKATALPPSTRYHLIRLYISESEGFCLHFQTSVMSIFFSTPVDIDIVLADSDDRAMVDIKQDKGRREKVPLYMDGESVKGTVTIRPKDGKRLEHTGIKVQFIGTIGRSSPNLNARQ
jgi:hypothetical protein